MLGGGGGGGILVQVVSPRGLVVGLHGMKYRNITSVFLKFGIFDSELKRSSAASRLISFRGLLLLLFF